MFKSYLVTHNSFLPKRCLIILLTTNLEQMKVQVKVDLNHTQKSVLSVHALIPIFVSFNLSYFKERHVFASVNDPL